MARYVLKFPWAAEAIDSRDRKGMTALHCAVAARHADVARMLVDAGADVLASDGDGRSVLYLASMYADASAHGSSWRSSVLRRAFSRGPVRLYR